MNAGMPLLGAIAFSTCSLGALYGGWRFFVAYRITGSRLLLAAAALSVVAPLAMIALAGAAGSGTVIQAGFPAVGAVAGAGFGVSRSRRLAPLTAGLWLPSAVAQWRDGDGGPLTDLLGTLLGEDGAAHASRSAALVNALAEPLGIPASETDDLVIAALLHGLSAGLNGGGRCEPGTAQYAATARMVQRVRSGKKAAGIILLLAERWDGTGPGGLIAEEIPVGTRAVAAAEAFDRASRQGLAHARKWIREESGGVFDPVVVDELMHLTRPVAVA